MTARIPSFQKKRAVIDRAYRESLWASTHPATGRVGVFRNPDRELVTRVRHPAIRGLPSPPVAAEPVMRGRIISIDGDRVFEIPARNLEVPVEIHVQISFKRKDFG